MDNRQDRDVEGESYIHIHTYINTYTNTIVYVHDYRVCTPYVYTTHELIYD